MKLKRLLAGISAMAIAATATAAMTVTASANAPTFSSSNNSVTFSPMGLHPTDDDTRVHLQLPGSPAPAGARLTLWLPRGTSDFEVVASARITFSMPPDATGADGNPIQVGNPEFITWGPNAWQQVSVRDANTTGTFTVPMSNNNDGDNLSFSITNWVPLDPVTAVVTLLDASGNVISLSRTDPGTGDGTPTTPTTPRPPRDPNAPAPKTGLPGLAVIGAVAALAAGSVVISRRRSK